MDKRLIKVLIGIWSVIAIFLIGLLIYFIANNKSLSNINIGYSKSVQSGKIQKDQSILLGNCSKIKVDLSSSDVILRTTDSDKLRVVETSRGALKGNEKITMNRDGNTIVIKKSDINQIHIFDFRNFDEKVEVYIPKSYSKDLDFKLSSGNIDFNSDMKFNDLNITQTSGDFTNDASITCNKINLKATSGNIKAGNLYCKYYDINTSSGDIDVDSLSGSGRIKSTSGNIKINYSDINEYTDVIATSGDIDLLIPKKLNFKFDGHCTSGDINSNFNIDYEGKKQNKASAAVGNEPYKKISVGTTSGNINISK